MMGLETFARLSLAAVAILAISGPAGAAPETRNGVVHVTASIVFEGGNTPPGTTFTAGVSVGASDFSSTTSGISQSITCNATITRSGTTGTTTVDCPYHFTFDSASYPKMQLGIGFSIFGGQAYESQSLNRAIPASGTTTPVSFSFNM